MKKKFKWKAGAAMRSALSTLAGRRKRFDRAGKQLLGACAGNIFPADLYFIATCNRALQNFDAFRMAMKADYYSTSMILLRVQLDSVLRCYGLTQTEDPHATAQQVLQGVKLSSLPDKHGKQMKDFYLVELFCKLAEANKVIKHIYELSSSYVHLSDSAIHHVLGRAKLIATGEHGFFVGSAEPDVPMLAKLQLVQAFEKVTDVFFDLGLSWTTIRGQFGNVDDLIEQYGPKS